MDISIKGTDMRQVGNELAKIIEYITTAIVSQAKKIKFYHLITVLFACVAMSIVLWPHQAALGWLNKTYGIASGGLAFMFAVASAVMANRPNKVLFSIAVTVPLLSYLAIFLAYTYHENTISLLTSACYITALISFIFILQFKSILNLKLHNVYGFWMILIGFALFNAPTLGAVGAWFKGNAGNGMIIGVLLMACGIWTSVAPQKRWYWFVLQTSVFLWYVNQTVFYSLRNNAGGYVGAAIAITMAACIVWPYTRLDSYIEGA